MNPIVLVNTPLGLLAILMVGLCIGSFLNVCIARWPANESVVAPRSRCGSCKGAIAWYDNIPLLSWLLLFAKCRLCRAPISVRYPAVEALTALALAGISIVLAPQLAPLPLWKSALILGAGWLLTASTLVVTAVDLEHMIIPDEISLNLMGLGPALAIVVPEIMTEPVLGAALLHGNPPLALARESSWTMALGSSLAGIALGGGLLWGLGLIGERVFRKEAMGFGDVKLLATLGGFLGVEGVLITLVLASLMGSFVGILTFLVKRTRHIPFGPHLAVGALLTFLIKGPLIHAALTYLGRGRTPGL
ncbi:MAG: A24 family peptidase [Planctomycetota bacterium]